MTKAENVSDIVRLNGGIVVGKTRLQKTAYFLKSRNVGYGFNFAYHYYGPYSEELRIAAEDAAALKMIEIETRTRQFGM